MDMGARDSGSDEGEPTPPTVKRPRRGAAAAVTPFPSPSGLAARAGRVSSDAAGLPAAPFPPPPFHDPASSPGLDALRRELVEELRSAFPLSQTARAYAVVLVCGDMRVDTADWLALVLAIDRLERDGVLLVKPLETREDPGGTNARDLLEESGKGKSRARLREDDAVLAETSKPPALLRLASEAPIEILPAAAVMDCLRFESGAESDGVEAETPAGTTRDARGKLGAVRQRGVPAPDADRESLKRFYVFAPGDELRTALLRKHSGANTKTDAGAGNASETNECAEFSGFTNPGFERDLSPATRSDSRAEGGGDRGDVDRVPDPESRPSPPVGAPEKAVEVVHRSLDGCLLEDDSATVTFAGASRQTRSRRIAASRFRTSAAPKPVSIRSQKKSGSAALRDALAGATAAGAMTLNVPVRDIVSALAELDETRARLDRAMRETTQRTERPRRIVYYVDSSSSS
jgi:hypothetical protein